MLCKLFTTSNLTRLLSWKPAYAAANARLCCIVYCTCVAMHLPLTVRAACTRCRSRGQLLTISAFAPADVSTYTRLCCSSRAHRMLCARVCMCVCAYFGPCSSIPAAC